MARGVFRPPLRFHTSRSGPGAKAAGFPTHMTRMRPTVRLVTAVTVAILAASCGNSPEPITRLDFRAARLAVNPGPARGPLRLLPENPRYFTDSSGRAIFLTGSHTWDNRQDIGTRRFEWTEYLTRLQEYNHNFIRLWVWEQPKGLTTGPDPAEPMATLTPELFSRTGPGFAADGAPKFDLTKYNAAFFGRLRQRIIDARDRGIYVSIMLFNGWSVEQKAGGGDPWKYHPFNRGNNITGIDGDPNHDGRGAETHSLQIPAVTRIQEAYVRKVLDTVADLDNVLYEISNESDADSEAWQYHLINYIKSYEATQTTPHPVGMTAESPPGSNASLLGSAADWISPIDDRGYKSDPPIAPGGKVILLDTDHLWGIGGDRSWAWKSFTRGLNVLYMDPWDAQVIPVTPNPDLRVNMGYILFYARRMNLRAMRPLPQLASTGYCLADPGSTYLVYLPGVDDGINMRFVARLFKLASPWISRHVNLDLPAVRGTLAIEWFNPRTGEILRTGSIKGGGNVRFTAPFGGDAVLYLTHGWNGSQH